MTKGQNEAENIKKDKAAAPEDVADKADALTPPAVRRSGAGSWMLFLFVLFLAFGFAAWSLMQPDITRDLAGTFGSDDWAGKAAAPDVPLSSTDPAQVPATQDSATASPAATSSGAASSGTTTASPAATPVATTTATALGSLSEAESAKIEARLSRIESRLAALGALVKTGSGDDQANVASLSAMEQRIATLETANRHLRSNDEGMGALILSLGQLQAALSSSAPFNRELSAFEAVRARFFAADSSLASAVEALSTPAFQGVLTVDELRSSFSPLAAAALNAERIIGPEGAEESGLFARGWARLKGLVTIRRIGVDVPGDTTEAHLARAEAFLQKGDLADALSETKAIEGPAAGPLAAWQADGDARLSADKAMEAISSAALAQVSGPGTGAGPGVELGP
ncbi:MAG: hypothetical protein HOI33_08380 [Rhodospirillaceae bacterium]|jgi:hypothetical protein|nr:hypothetical protein [Rhodospirillaceae bacterium]MBT5659896.1 hypothetical protein [Rhodospirillaceae bacterium]MBT5752711.1 hypothetical protein [Rhodospirillaceae bacterium]